MSQFKRITEDMKLYWHDYYILYPRYFVDVYIPVIVIVPDNYVRVVAKLMCKYSFHITGACWRLVE